MERDMEDRKARSRTLKETARRVSLLVALITAATLAAGWQPARAQRDDNKGTEFILGFMQNHTGSLATELFVTGDTETTGTVSIPGLEFSEPFSVTPGTITTISLPTSVEVRGSDFTTNLGILVTAEDEIVVYGLNQRNATTDAFLGLPTDILGAEYLVLTYRATVGAGYPSEFLIAGVQDGTTVQITPSVSTGSRTAGVAFPISLDRLDVYQLQTDGNLEDLSGTVITSDQPIAVFGGVTCVYLPDASVSACDHIAEQLPPTETWGASFLTVPLATRTAGDVFRIMARDDGTTIEIDGVQVESDGFPLTLASGEFYQTDLASGTFHEIDTSGPALVMQYSKGQSADGVTSDPFMMMIPPTQQFLRSYTVTTPAAAPVTFTNYVNVVAPTAVAADCRIDGGAFTSAFTAIGTTGFSGAQEPVAIGAHTLTCPSEFGAYAYGFAGHDSYGYPGGLSLEPIANETCELTPDRAVNPVGSQHTVTARLTESVVNPLPGVGVAFFVDGSNEAAEGTCSPNPDCITGENGEISFTYTDSGGVGVDQISGSFLNSDEETIACIPTPHVLKFWDDDCNENGVPDTCDLSCDAFGESCNVFTDECGLSQDLDENGVPDECVPAEPIVHPAVAAGAWGEGIATYEDDGLTTVFLAAQDAGLLIYQYTDPADPDPDPIATFTLSGDCSFDDLALVDDTVVAAAGWCGVPVIDVSTPSSPVLRGVFEAPTYAKDVTALAWDTEGIEGVGYVADYFEGLWIVEATDPGAPLPLEFSGTLIPIGSGLEGNPIAVDFSADDGGTRVYVAHTEGLSVVDPNLPVGEGDPPEVLGSCTTNPDGLPLDNLTAVPQDVALGGDLAYVPLWMDGLLAMDVSVPSELPDECSGEVLQTDQAYFKATLSGSGSALIVTEGQCGLAAFEITDSGLEELDFSPLPIAEGFECPPAPPGDPLDRSSAFAWGIHERDGNVAVAWGRLEPRGGGFQIVEVPGSGAQAVGGEPISEPDGDADGVADSQDNCLEAPNAAQTDSDSDGFGDACDADADGSGLVDAGDFILLSAAWGARAGDDRYDSRIDLDADGMIGAGDFIIVSQRWHEPPGPSGLACAGTVPCP
jgi:hypothetical protein